MDTREKEWLHKEKKNIPFIITTEYVSVSDVVCTIKLGARDYLLKPVHREHLLELAEKLKVSRRSLQDYRNNGILPYTQVGGKILYRASDIEHILTDGYQEAYHLKRRT